MRGIRCAVCNHQRFRDADAMISAGRLSDPVIARSLGVSRDSVARHRRAGHVVPPSGTPPEAGSATDPASSTFDTSTPEGRFLAMRADLDSMLKANPSTTQKLAIIDALRKLEADRGRLTGPPPSPTVGISEVEGLPELIAVIAQVLEPYPRIRHEIAVAMAKAGLIDYDDPRPDLWPPNEKEPT